MRDPVVPRDASIMLSVQAPTHRYRDPPQAAVLAPLCCENLGTWRDPYFHGGGLLPDDIDQKTRVLTPGVYAPKGKWALRSLTVEEVIVAKDFGRILPVLMAVERLNNRFFHPLIPGKILVALALQWGCNGVGGGCGGGSFLLKKAKDLGRTPGLTINPDEAPFKRQKLEVEYGIKGLAKEGDLRSPEDRRSEVPPSPSEVWSLKSVFEDQDELDPKLVLEKRNESGVKLKQGQTLRPEVLSEKSGSLSPRDEGKVADSPPTLGGNLGESFAPVKPSSGFPNDSAEVSKTCLDEILHEHRQRKAVKSDNAKVPEYLWEAHLIEGCEGINWDDDVISKVGTVIDWLHEQMLRWWKRRVTSAYGAWVRAKYGLIAPQ
jgi:hypothetical protein